MGLFHVPQSNLEIAGGAGRQPKKTAATTMAAATAMAAAATMTATTTMTSAAAGTEAIVFKLPWWLQKTKGQYSLTVTTKSS